MVREVKAEDQIREHDFNHLTADEQLEIQMFKTLKRDPYFVHYVKNYQIREFSDHTNQMHLSVDALVSGMNTQDQVKFDNIQLPHFVERLYNRLNHEKMYNGSAYG